jgi:hypothetical protein
MHISHIHFTWLSQTSDFVKQLCMRLEVIYNLCHMKIESRTKILCLKSCILQRKTLTFFNSPASKLTTLAENLWTISQFQNILIQKRRHTKENSKLESKWKMPMRKSEIKMSQRRKETIRGNWRGGGASWRQREVVRQPTSSGNIKEGRWLKSHFPAHGCIRQTEPDSWMNAHCSFTHF